jgi:hypothetical protein
VTRRAASDYREFEDMVMIRLLAAFFGLCLLMPVAFSTNAAFQEFSYTSPKAEYTINFPSAAWKKVGEPDDVHQHTEFIYGDRLDGYLRIRKEALTDGLTVRQFGEQDQDQRTRFLPGFVTGKGESFNGRLDGWTLSYEYTQAGKPMSGRTYYLQADAHTVYVLRFTGLRQKLLSVRNQTDFIARSLRVK